MKVETQPFDGADYAKMIDDTFISAGNTDRLKKVIDKARSGQDVTLAYLGGSITEGAGATGVTSNADCYAETSYNEFKKAYGLGDGSNVHFCLLYTSSAVCNTAYAKAKAKLSVKKITMEKGTKKNIVIKKKSKSCKYTFKSKNKKIAKVNAKGKVTAVKKGTTKITVKEKSKKTKKTRSLGRCV